MYALGLDFGGTKLAAGVVDLDARRIVDVVQIPTPPNAVQSCDALLSESLHLKGIGAIQGIGVSFGGHVRENRILRSVQVAGWEDFPLVTALQARFGALPVQIANDANATALAEWRFGAGQDVRSLLYVTVSTGIGGGIVIDGRLYEGRHGAAGEIGHTLVAPDGPLCPCGKRGCLEAVAAGPAIARRAVELFSERLPGSSPELTARDVARLAAEGDDLARQALREAGIFLGTALANALNLLDMDCIVVGGGVTRSGDLWWQAVKDAAKDAVFRWHSAPDLRLSGLGEHEGIWGGVALIAGTLRADMPIR
mgnify:CR=1 FL=1